jgi:hypothetical protein
MIRFHSTCASLALIVSICAIAPCAAQQRTDKQKSSALTPTRTMQGVPDWLAGYRFKQDKFTFVRIEYSSADRRRSSWATDYPDADLNLSTQLGRLTTLKFDPKGLVLKLTDGRLSDYPFIYMSEPGSLSLSDEEVAALRKYLLGGGFLMVDDFWGQAEWKQFYTEIKRVFPDREPTELPLEHKIFHCVFELHEKPQVLSIHAALSNQKSERADANQVHYKGIFDNKGRMMAIICHNTDLADGWERPEVDEKYFREYSEKKAYPMGLNIVFFALTQGK